MGIRTMTVKELKQFCDLPGFLVSLDGKTRTELVTFYKGGICFINKTGKMEVINENIDEFLSNYRTVLNGAWDEYFIWDYKDKNGIWNRTKTAFSVEGFDEGGNGHSELMESRVKIPVKRVTVELVK
jgi:hypothetical protein